MKKHYLFIYFVVFYSLSVFVGCTQEVPQKPELIKLPFAFLTTDSSTLMENTPVLFNSRLFLVSNFRPSGGSNVDEKNSDLSINDLVTGAKVSRFGKSHSFVSAFVNNSELNVFALDFTTSGKIWDHPDGIDRFVTNDLKNWESEKVIIPESNEHLFNSSVCRDDKGYVMAYESDKPVQFCFKFARSNDLSKWDKMPGLSYTGENNEYSACPVIRYFKPFYYVIYLHAPIPGHNGYISYMSRSKDLVNWELSPFNPILEANKEIGEGCNNSDVDILEYEGRTYLYYATGDQATWGTVRVAMYNGSMRKFYENYFPEGIILKKISTIH